MKMKLWWSLIVTSLWLTNFIECRIHTLEVKGDANRFIPISTFGFKKNGSLAVSVVDLHSSSINESAKIGFTLVRGLSDQELFKLKKSPCINKIPCLVQYTGIELHEATFTLDFKNKVLAVDCTEDFSDLYIYNNMTALNILHHLKEDHELRSNDIFNETHTQNISTNNTVGGQCLRKLQLPVTERVTGQDHYYSTSFAVYFNSEKDKGVYTLYLHNCPSSKKNKIFLDFTVEVTEKNDESYLSVGEIPLPRIYSIMFDLYYFTSSFVFYFPYIFSRRPQPVFKIHRFVSLLLAMKALSSQHQYETYEFIKTDGARPLVWKILHYIIHSLETFAFLIAILMVFTGWRIFKSDLSIIDKKFFMLVIPVQILSTGMEVFKIESEESKGLQDVVFYFVDYFFWIIVAWLLISISPEILKLHESIKSAIADGYKNAHELKRAYKWFYYVFFSYFMVTHTAVLFVKLLVPYQQYGWVTVIIFETATYLHLLVVGFLFGPLQFDNIM